MRHTRMHSRFDWANLKVCMRMCNWKWKILNCVFACVYSNLKEEKVVMLCYSNHNGCQTFGWIKRKEERKKKHAIIFMENSILWFFFDSLCRNSSTIPDFSEFSIEKWETDGICNNLNKIFSFLLCESYMNTEHWTHVECISILSE